MAVLLNDVSNMRFRLELVRRIDPGVSRPAALEAQASVDRFRHQPDLEHRFEPVLDLGGHAVLDLDVIRLLEEVDRLYGGELGELVFQPLPPDAAAMAPRPHGWQPGAAAEPPRPPFALRILAVAGGLVVEIGLDLALCLEPLGGLAVPPGRDLALFRYATTRDALRGFAIGLAEEYARFPTDPSRIEKGPAT